MGNEAQCEITACRVATENNLRDFSKCCLIDSSSDRHISYLRVFLPFYIDEILQGQNSLLSRSRIHSTGSQILQSRQQFYSMHLLRLNLTILDKQHRQLSLFLLDFFNHIPYHMELSRISICSEATACIKSESSSGVENIFDQPAVKK